MNPSLTPLVQAFIEQEQLPADYLDTVEHWYWPMVEEMLVKISTHQGTFITGISGCQGSGKSTLASLLVMLLGQSLGLRCINLSIDDFYLTHDERQELGKTVHPLLATRGVPGTHDVDLAIATMAALQEEGVTKVPRFNKAVDDRFPENECPVVQGPVDVIVLEGWCLGIDAEQEDELVEPINDLESQEDEDGTWRRYVNTAISKGYHDWYGLVDYLVMLKPPSFEKVYEWRQNQEDKLAAAHVDAEDHRIMSPKELERFVQHYQRVTEHGLKTLADSADVVFQLTDRQTIENRTK